jgi:CheY-like chemotaxis protein
MTRRVLLVEDDLPKQNQIAEALALAPIEMDHAGSVNEAIRKLDKQRYDFVLLDMSLPTFSEGAGFFSGGRQQDFGGRQILTYMWEMEMQARVLLVTQLPSFKNEAGVETRLTELDQTLKKDFPGLYFGYTSFHHSTDAWVQGIIAFLE